MSATFAPSKYQVAIFDWVKNGKGDAFVDAVAGSGKTTTLVEVAKILRNTTLDMSFFAFNKDIVNVLNTRLPAPLQAQTLNSLGYQILRENVTGVKWKMSFNKYGDMLFQSIKDMGIPQEQFAKVLGVAKQLVSYSQSNLGDGSNDSLDDLVDYYGIELPGVIASNDLFNLVRSTLERGEGMAKQGIIAFDDQIWLPAKWNLAPRNRSQFIMIDEAQDLSKAKLEMVLSARAEGGRILFVGDPRQSIYGFAGADAQAVPNILERTGAQVLPLSVSYRCGTAIVAHAQKLVPHIEAAESAHEGEVKTVKENYLMENVANGDLILSRVTAPLLGLCIRLIAKGKPARVKGREIGKQLVSATKEALGKRPWDDVQTALDEYLDKQTIVIMKRSKGASSALQALSDKVDGIRACIVGFGAEVTDLASFAAKVESIFGDGDALINLSTIHRAKGQEADTVYIVAPEKLPLFWKNQQPWEAEQERNLDYVARTRAIRSLVYVPTEKGPSES